MPNKKLTIIIDVDGVVAETLTYWLDVIHSKTGVRATIEDIKVWELHKSPALAEVPAQFIYSRLQDPGFYEAIPMVPHADEFCKKLQDDGHKVYFVTARHGKVSMPETLSWFEKHMPWVKENQVGFFYDKERIKADVIIDDKAETLMAYQKEWPDAILLAPSYPYNECVKDDVIRIERGDKFWEKVYKGLTFPSRI